ncbi:unnamed protein product [Brassicogethes aeneus]|uniref:Maelstrom domain-containing protein n=1 Tax=Brassicogethes aeneus TaxID=1431903 RepID=A0A9P0BE17_BRAAE|nr:unnamed protein product [Brassicogethes aeneus]
MAPKKQQKRNPFYYFMMEVKRNAGNEIDNNTAQEIAGAKWAKMSADEKRKYEIKAAEVRNNVSLKKYTSEGIDIEEIERKTQAERKWQEEMKTTISQDIRGAHKSGSIDTKTFFVLYINSFVYQETEDRYFPAEIGLLSFNLREGVLQENIYHSMIQPGQLPMGYFNEAMIISNEKHKIQPPSSLDTGDNTEKVFNEICEFISQRFEGGQDCPILYVKEKYMKMCQNILDSWTAQFNECYFFKVYNLQLMLNELRSTIEQTNVVMANSFGFYEISKDVYSHVSNIACEFHEIADAQISCAKSIVTRQAYVICDNCCPILEIPLIPGHHVPESTRTDRIRNSSRASTFSSKQSEITFETPRSDADTGSVISFTSRSEGWDNESVASTGTSVATLEEQFPALGQGRSNGGAGEWFSQNSNGSVRSSYSGAAGSNAGFSQLRKAAMPALLKQMKDLNFEEGTSTRSGSTNPLRYNRTWSQMSDSDSVTSEVSQSSQKPFNNAPNDFPALGGKGKARGRGGFRK